MSDFLHGENRWEGVRKSALTCILLYTSLMRKVMSMSAFAVTFVAIVFFGPPIAISATNDLPCDNPHTATTADIAAGYPAGSQVCPSDYQQSEVTPESGEAKQYLRGILCSPDRDDYGGKGPDGTIQGLDAKFSICAAKFLQSARASGINVCVREGARSVEKQNEYVRRGIIACKKGAMCEHPRGIAIDVNVFPNPNSCPSYKRLHDSAPSFGVTFYLGCKDAYHFVPKKGSDCSGGGVIQPETFYDYPQYYEQSSSLSSLVDMVRQALGQDQMNSDMCLTSLMPIVVAPAGTVPQSRCLTNAQVQQPPQPPPPPPPPQQQQPQSQQSQQPQQQPPQSQQQPQQQQPQQQSSQNTSPRGNTPTLGTSDYENTSNPDLEPVSGYIIDSVGTAGPAFNPDTNSVTTLTPTTTPRIIYATGTITLLRPTYSSSQTFTSGDLVNNPSPLSVAQQQQNGFFFQILTSMKNTLLSVLNYLRPFGGAAPKQVTPLE